MIRVSGWFKKGSELTDRQLKACRRSRENACEEFEAALRVERAETIKEALNAWGDQPKIGLDPKEVTDRLAKETARLADSVERLIKLLEDGQNE
jgi:hypothetical protein